MGKSFTAAQLQEKMAIVNWERMPIGIGLGTREATLRERLMLYHTRYCFRKYALWDVLTFWAKWTADFGPAAETPEGDLCRWLDWELDRADRTREDQTANITATLMVVLTLMREQFRANAAPSLPAWDEDAERAAMMTARAARKKMDAEARAAGDYVPEEPKCIRGFYDPRTECPRAFFAKASAPKAKGVRRGTA